ncbi:uncharacterized protein LOC6592625 isoform X1 [Drosophila persimilis]|uniref:uncharacterized protein LOC6592625 isoform X1 n=1 Tax=Drosophila persimilis TaxID=7234 RepID=UPI000F08B112|nr:uncharacterized protein LOC6592625 isoform X1 [Drosophila persimilis]
MGMEKSLEVHISKWLCCAASCYEVPQNSSYQWGVGVRGGGDGKGCKGPKGDILPGEMVQDEKVCGVFYCATDKGDGFIHYCQLTATFAECSGTTVSTTVDFPDCCWLCVKDKKCDKEGGAEAGGAGGAEGAGVATEKPPP